MSEKKTEAELRHDIRREHSLSEDNPKEKTVIDNMLKLKKDKFQLLRQKKELESKKSDEPQGKQEPQGNKHSLKDIRALNNVHDEDVDKVTEYAEKFHDGVVVDAMKDDDLKAILKGRDEERKASDAIDTGKKRSGSSKIDGHKTLESIRKNPSKEFSDEEMDAVTEARWQEKHPKR